MAIDTLPIAEEFLQDAILAAKARFDWARGFEPLIEAYALDGRIQVANCAGESQGVSETEAIWIESYLRERADRKP